MIFGGVFIQLVYASGFDDRFPGDHMMFPAAGTGSV
jgi:hypothetical protein